MYKVASFFVFALGVASASQLFTATGNEPANNNPIDATANFSFGAGTLTLTLTNLESGITDVAQNISDFEFAFAGTTVYTGSTGSTIDCTGGSCVTNSTQVTGKWGFGTDGADLIVCIVCPGSAVLTTAKSGTPAYTIIGPNPVDGGSVHSGPHSPFYNQTATFTFTNSLFTANSTVSNVIFSFGTTAGDNVTGALTTPEPLSLFMLGSGLALLGLRKKFARK